ncbi:MAG: hypothetical protein QXP22_03560 [Candidatus Anstonellales archaeon]
MVNIYRTNFYLILTAIALLMIVISLLNISKLKLGTEFLGGSFLSAEIRDYINPEDVEKSFLENGIEAKVSVFRIENVYKLEVEVPFTNELLEAEKVKAGIDKNIEEYAKTSDQRFLEMARENLQLLVNKNISNLSPAEIQDYADKILEEKRTDYEKKIRAAISPFVKDVSIQTTSPALGSAFLEKVKTTLAISAILAIIAVFWIFKEPFASLAVLSGAFADIIIALGFMATMGIPLTLASVAALLMLVGYSLDTDILLTTRVIKRSDGEKQDRAFEAMKTGLTMTTTGIIAFIILFVIGQYLRIATYYQIGAVVIAGLIGDIFATWGINAVLLLKFSKKGES